MEKQKQVTEMTGEEIASLISAQYQSLMLAQNNLQVLQGELARRQTDKTKKEK